MDLSAVMVQQDSYKSSSECYHFLFIEELEQTSRDLTLCESHFLQILSWSITCPTSERWKRLSPPELGSPISISFVSHICHSNLYACTGNPTDKRLWSGLGVPPSLSFSQFLVQPTHHSRGPGRGKHHLPADEFLVVPPR